MLLPNQLSPIVVDSGVSVGATAFSSQRKIVLDSKGNMFAVYLKPLGNLSEVFLSRSIDNGLTWYEVGQVSEGNYESVRASVALSARDGVYVFWTKFIGKYGQIFYRIYDKNGWSDEHQLTAGDAYSGYPSACFDSKGRIHLVWYGYDGIAYQVFYSVFDGTHWSPPQKLSQGYPDSVNPAIAVDSSDNIHVAWFKSNGRRYEINYIRWSGSWGTQTVLSSPSADAYNPSLAVNSRGNIFIAWDEGQGPITQIYYSINDGSRWSQETALTRGPSAQNPSIAIDKEDNAYVVYDKSDGQIYLRKYDGDWLPEQQITSSGRNTYPTLRWSFLNNPLSDIGGRIDLMWTSREGNLTSLKYSAINISSNTTTTPSQGSEEQGPSPEATQISILSGVALIVLFAIYFSTRVKKRT